METSETDRIASEDERRGFMSALPVILVSLAVASLDWLGWVHEFILMTIAHLALFIVAVLMIEHRRFRPRTLDLFVTIVLWSAVASWLIYD